MGREGEAAIKAIAQEENLCERREYAEKTLKRPRGTGGLRSISAVEGKRNSRRNEGIEKSNLRFSASCKGKQSSRKVKRRPGSHGLG